MRLNQDSCQRDLMVWHSSNLDEQCPPTRHLSDVALIIVVMQCLVGVGYVFEFTSIGTHK